MSFVSRSLHAPLKVVLSLFFFLFFFLPSALVWGSSVKHNPQKVGKDHVLMDEDVVQIVKRWGLAVTCHTQRTTGHYCVHAHVSRPCFLQVNFPSCSFLLHIHFIVPHAPSLRPPVHSQHPFAQTCRHFCVWNKVKPLPISPLNVFFFFSFFSGFELIIKLLLPC